MQKRIICVLQKNRKTQSRLAAHRVRDTSNKSPSPFSELAKPVSSSNTPVHGSYNVRVCAQRRPFSWHNHFPFRPYLVVYGCLSRSTILTLLNCALVLCSEHDKTSKHTIFEELSILGWLAYHVAQLIISLTTAPAWRKCGSRNCGVTSCRKNTCTNASGTGPRRSRR